ncbi:hypothetical protein [Mesorhizobium sp. GR13]|uniref:hypothetical protein n=1 Tax=Mesorhizobium sp. GR13 TaxID=2562308 RepID=UPI0010C0667F|nr:hypothetical protein [Mesorhizobium sp. GR13]
MSAYIPEYVFGSLPDANGLWTGEYGLKPWPAHLRTRPTAPESNGSSESTAFLAVTPSMRKKLVATCEALIALLDEIDGDENVEGTADEEPLLGWPDGGQKPNAEMSCDGDREADDCDIEPGSDEERELGWQDEGSQASLQGSLYDGEPDLGFCGHGTGWREGETTDDREQENEHRDDSDYEHTLGWPETYGQGLRVGIDISPSDYEADLQDGDYHGGSAQFDGSGEHIAKKQIKEHKRRKRSAGRKGEILFRREDADSTPSPRYMWNDEWIRNLPPEATETLIPHITMHKASK